MTYPSAESAGVLRVLRDLDLLDHLTNRSAISSAVFADNADLLGSLGLVVFD